MNKKLIVLSIDAFVTEDLEIMKTLPNFSELLAQSSIVEKNYSTYPTLTKSIHTSIFTGCYPEHHGVIANERFEPGNLKAEWYNNASDVKVPTLVDECTKAGYTAAYVFYPLTTGTKNALDLHRPAIHEKVLDPHPIIEQYSTPGLYAKVKEHSMPAWDLPQYYCWDDFTTRSIEWILREYSPDIIYAHLTTVDHERHVNGVHNDVLKDTYAFLDKGLGRILDTLKEMGLYDKTIINITADHGQLDIKKMAAPNVLFAEHGLLSLDEEGKLTDWKAYCHGCGLSAHIYVKNHDPEVIAAARKVLEDNKELLGIESVTTRAEAKRDYHLDGEFDLVVETAGDTSFVSRFKGKLLNHVDNSDYIGSRATHGHQPHKGVQPCFILRNPFSKKRVVIPNGRIIDQAPTLAALLGCTMPQADGKPMAELLD